MDGKKVVSKEVRRARHLRGVARQIRRYERKQEKGKGDFSCEIGALVRQAETLATIMVCHGQGQ
jgi:hypothetical protein